MHAHKEKITIPADHQLTLRLPDNFPTGPAEVIVLADSSAEKRIVKLAGILALDKPPPMHIDQIADSLQEFRQERKQRFEKLGKNQRAQEDT